MPRRLASRRLRRAWAGVNPGRARAATAVILVVLATAATGALALAVPSPARADGDPASDALLGQSVFYPYTSPIPRALQATLNAETARLSRAGLRLKVAIIGAPLDLGAIPELFGKPAAYARFLDTEISFNGPQPLLTVMADGYGTAALPPRLRMVAAALPRPAGRSDEALTRAAIVAVGRLAATDGHPLPAQPIPAAPGPTPGSSGAGSGLILALVAVLAIALAGVILAARRRRGALGIRTRREPPQGRSHRPSRGTGR